MYLIHIGTAITIVKTLSMLHPQAGENTSNGDKGKQGHALLPL